MLENLKKQIIEVAQKADTMGYCKKGSGNFSIYDRERDFMVITPSGKNRFELKPEDIPVIDGISEKVLEGTLKPSTEWPIHLQAYRTRKDITAVVHTHSHYATAFAILGKEIPPIVFEAANYGVKTKVAVYGMPGSKALADSVIEPLKEADVVLMKSHGILVVGNNLNQVLLKASYVEDVAEIYSYCMTIGNGEEPKAIPQSEFDAFAATLK